MKNERAQTLTKRQREIYDFVCSFITNNGYSPTVFDIARQFNLRATSTITEHLQALERAGFIRRGKKGALVQLLEPKQEGEEVFESVNEESFMPETVALPFYGLIAAGSPIEATNEREETVFVSAELVKGDCYSLRAKGNSMIEDGILDSDLLIIKHANVAEQGQTVVALIDGTSATVKRFFKKGKMVSLEPANSSMKPIVVEASRVKIQGIVQAVVRVYK